jgi:hypothetical protein
MVCLENPSNTRRPDEPITVCYVCRPRALWYTGRTIARLPGRGSRRIWLRAWWRQESDTFFISSGLTYTHLPAVDWWGLSEYDAVFAAAMLTTDLTNFPMIPDRCTQGMLNALLLMKMLTKSGFAKDPMVTFQGVSVISQVSTDWHYYGNSLGGILGSVYMAASTDVVRGVAGVSGGPFSLLLPRSSDFAALFDILKLRYTSPVDRISIMAVLQNLWVRMDPSVSHARLSEWLELITSVLRCAGLPTSYFH